MTSKERLIRLFELVYGLEELSFELHLLLKTQRAGILRSVANMSDEQADSMVLKMQKFVGEISTILIEPERMIA